MHIIDVILLILAVVAVLVGAFSGLMKSFGGFFKRRAFVAALILGIMFGPAFSHFFPETFLEGNRLLTDIIMIVASVIALTVIFKLIGSIIKAAGPKQIGAASRILGAAFRVLELAVMVYGILALAHWLGTFEIFNGINTFINDKTIILKLLYNNNPVLYFFAVPVP